MKKHMFLLLLLVPFLQAGAPEQLPQDEKVAEKQVEYKSVMGMSLQVDLFLPEEREEEGLRPAIAFFHGGGWAYGDQSEFHGACRRYARMGYVCASFQYRLCINQDGSYPHPEITPVEGTRDARSALRWMKQHAHEFGVDSSRIIAAE